MPCKDAHHVRKLISLQLSGRMDVLLRKPCIPISVGIVSLNLLIIRWVSILKSGHLWCSRLIIVGWWEWWHLNCPARPRMEKPACSTTPQSRHFILLISCHFSRQSASHVQAGHEALGKAHMRDFYWKKWWRELHCIHI